MRVQDWDLLLGAPPAPTASTASPRLACVDEMVAPFGLDSLTTSNTPGMEKKIKSLADHLAPTPTLVSPGIFGDIFGGVGLHQTAAAGMHQAHEVPDAFGLPSPPGDGFDSYPSTRATSPVGAVVVPELMVPEYKKSTPSFAPIPLHTMQAFTKPPHQFKFDNVPRARNSHDYNSSEFGGHTSQSSPSPSPSPSPPPSPPHGFGGKGGRSFGHGPVRTSRTQRIVARDRGSTASSYLASEGDSEYDPSASISDAALEAANAVVELAQVLKIDVTVPAERESVLRALKKQPVLMMSAEAWKVYLPYIKLVLPTNELNAIKKQRRRALGTVYARNSRGKQAAEKSAHSGQVAELRANNIRLEEENAMLKEEMAQLRAASAL